MSCAPHCWSVQTRAEPEHGQLVDAREAVLDDLAARDERQPRVRDEQRRREDGEEDDAERGEEDDEEELLLGDALDAAQRLGAACVGARLQPRPSSGRVGH